MNKTSRSKKVFKQLPFLIQDMVDRFHRLQRRIMVLGRKELEQGLVRERMVGGELNVLERRYALSSLTTVFMWTDCGSIG